ncbi:hypothetical protein FO519_000442 [Halicephalobus sp. NKZ332]|nr:hypothetical protein FO519_000442 [Halicephalobus sp. NKZ332]
MEEKTLLFFTFAILTIYVATAESAVARMEVELGKPAIFDFGENMLVVKRTTRASKKSQYIFAAPHQDGSWTTDGTDKVGSNAKLYWNGTLVIDKITLDDIGSYEMPMETPRPNLPRSMIDFVIKE